MKHVVFADKSLLIGDAAADALLVYAALIARNNSGDVVTLNAIAADGSGVQATFLLDSGAILIAESTTSALPEPDNTEALNYMAEGTRRQSIGRGALPLDEGALTWEDDLGA